MFINNRSHQNHYNRLVHYLAKKNKHANSTVISCFKRLLPVGLNIFGGRELDIVQKSKEKFLKVRVNIYEAMYVHMLIKK